MSFAAWLENSLDPGAVFLRRGLFANDLNRGAEVQFNQIGGNTWNNIEGEPSSRFRLVTSALKRIKMSTSPQLVLELASVADILRRSEKGFSLRLTKPACLPSGHFTCVMSRKGRCSYSWSALAWPFPARRLTPAVVITSP